MGKTFRTSLKPPFLRRIYGPAPTAEQASHYPFNIPFLSDGIDLELKSRVTIIVGDNGSGKSTLLEAIAQNCGFSLTGGSRNHTAYDSKEELLAAHLRFAWKPRIGQGFFLRAETLALFVNTIDQIAREEKEAGLPVTIYSSYGGKSLDLRSHGEAFVTLFENQFGRQGIYILDEPEAALSPERQIQFLRLIKRMDESDQCQLVIATHSPLIMAYPSARLLAVTDHGLKDIEFHETRNFKILREFYINPDGFIAGVLLDEEADE